MSEHESTSFEERVTFFDNITGTEGKVHPDSLMSALATAHVVGDAESRSDETELGVVRYARKMITLYNTAEALDKEGRVEPPLSYEQKKHIIDQRDILSAITDANSDDGPTDTNGLDTTDRK